MGIGDFSTWYRELCSIGYRGLALLGIARGFCYKCVPTVNYCSNVMWVCTHPRHGTHDKKYLDPPKSVKSGTGKLPKEELPSHLQAPPVRQPSFRVARAPEREIPAFLYRLRNDIICHNTFFMISIILHA